MGVPGCVRTPQTPREPTLAGTPHDRNFTKGVKDLSDSPQPSEKSFLKNILSLCRVGRERLVVPHTDWRSLLVSDLTSVPRVTTHMERLSGRKSEVPRVRGSTVCDT